MGFLQGEEPALADSRRPLHRHPRSVAAASLRPMRFRSGRSLIGRFLHPPPSTLHRLRRLRAGGDRLPRASLGGCDLADQGIALGMLDGIHGDVDV